MKSGRKFEACEFISHENFPITRREGRHVHSSPREACGIFRAGKDFWKLFLLAPRKIGIFLEEDSATDFSRYWKFRLICTRMSPILHFIIIFSKLVYYIIVYSNNITYILLYLPYLYINKYMYDIVTFLVTSIGHLLRRKYE